MNKDTAYIIGGTFSGRGQFASNMYASGSLTYTKGKAYDTDRPLSSIPPLFGDLEFGYDNNKFGAGLRWRFNGEKKLEDYNIIEGIDNFNYNFSNQVMLLLNLNNLFDTHYKEFASSISAPGRHLNIALNVLL